MNYDLKDKGNPRPVNYLLPLSNPTQKNKKEIQIPFPLPLKNAVKYEAFAQEPDE